MEVTVEQTELPVSRSDVQKHLGITGDDHDQTIASLIWAAARDLENSAAITLRRRTYRLTLDSFPRFGCPIQLEYPPIASVTSCSYYDRDGVQQTLDPADAAELQIKLSTKTQGEVYPGTDSTLWPDTQLRRLNNVEIVYVAGYADQDSVPEVAKQYLLVWIRNQFDNPDGHMTKQVESGLNSLAGAMWSGTYGDPDVFPS